MEENIQWYHYDGAKIDWTKQYALIGEFVVEFEHFTHWIRSYIQSLFMQTSNIDPVVSDIIFTQSIFTTAPLFDTYRSLVCHVLHDDEMVKSDLKKMATRVESVIKSRNQLLHGFYLIGRHMKMSSTKESQPEFSHTKKGYKTGKDATKWIVSDAQMMTLVEEVRALTDDFKALGNSIMNKVPDQEQY